MKELQSESVTRRNFIKKSGIGLATAAVTMHAPYIVSAHAAPDDPIKIGLVGCGGRGTGAALDAVNAATNVIYPDSGYHTEDAKSDAKATAKNVEIIALADVFEDRLKSCDQQLQKVGVNVPKENHYVGFEAYKEVMKIPEINYVILATPPHFRPLHLRAAVEAGKNAFIEKPVAVDAAGVRSIIESGEIAKKKGLTIGAGTQRRRDFAMRELVKKIHDGEIGDIRSGVGRWLLGELWYIEPKEGWTDMEAQLRNWMYYNWLSGDIFVEQFIHSIDLLNWVMQSPPTKAIGVGGREVRTDPKLFGNVFDHYGIQYEYPNDATVFCLDRQTNGCANHIDDEIIGSKGRASFTSLRVSLKTNDGNRWRYRGETNNPYQEEHNELVQAIRLGTPINEAKQAAESTLTAIMGREAAYSGQEITFEMAMKAKQDFTLPKYDFGPVNVDPVPVPGKYRFI